MAVQAPDATMTETPEDSERPPEVAKYIGFAGETNSELLARVYSELRAVAGQLMNKERSDHTLQPTCLVHEAFLRIGGGEQMERIAYLATAAQVMRRVLIDHARGRDAQKRGGKWKRVTLQGLSAETEEEVDVLQLDLALAELAELDPRQARIVELRFFSGMTCEEIAEHLAVSRNTVVRDLTVSRAWLQRALSKFDSPPSRE